MTKNMTKGSPFSLILMFAIPLLLGNLFQQLYNMVDTAIVGQTLGPEALGSVGSTTSVTFLIMGFCIGLAAGFAVPIAQAFGAQNDTLLRRYVYHASVLSAGFAAVVTLICALLTPQILRVLHVADILYKDAYSYLLILFLGIPFTFMYNLLSGMLRSVGDSRTPFIILACSAVLNIFLDLLFIIVFHWGTAGAALATILAQGISGFLCLRVIILRFEILHVRREDRRWMGQIAGNLLKMGIPMGLQFSITAIGSMMIQSSANALGAIYTSALAASMKIKQLTTCPFDALSAASSTFASQNYGAGKLDRIRRGIIIGTLMAIVYGLLAGLVLIAFGRQMSLLFLSADRTDLLDIAHSVLRVAAFFYMPLGVLCVVRTCIQGIGFSGRAVFSGVAEMACRTITALVFVPLYGFRAILVADPIAWSAGALYCTVMIFFCMNLIRKRSRAAV